MAGKLIYLMGPSGAGKDSMLDAARARLEARGCGVARRVITRSAEAVGEDAVAVSSREFDKRLVAGEFAMSWRANGLCYGIPVEIDNWMAEGRQVLVNGSRGYLADACRRYPDLLPVLLEVSADALRSRLMSRGRESLQEIEARLARNAHFTVEGVQEVDARLVRLDNSGSLEDTVAQLLQVIEAASQQA